MKHSLNLRQIRRGNEIAGCKRFVGFATVPLQFPEIAAGELRRLKNLEGIVGIQICTHCPKFEEPVSDFNFDGRYDLGHLKFEPLWKCASELSTPIFLHPWYMYYFNGENHMTTLPHGKKIAKKGSHWAPWLVGMPSEEANAILQICASGLLAKYPNLKICIAHGSGAFPCLCHRIKQGIACKPNWVWPYIGNYITNERNAGNIEAYLKEFDGYLRNNFLVDSLNHDPDALPHLAHIFGEDSICFGTDYPFPLGEVHGFGIYKNLIPGERIERSKNLSGSLKKGIFHENATQFLKL